MNVERAIARLRAAQLCDDDAFDSASKAYRVGHNVGIGRAISLLQHEQTLSGLRELRAAPVQQLPRHWLAEHEAERG